MTVETAVHTDEDGHAVFRLDFNASLCIHARFCVLQAPQVFKANTPGEWLFPGRLAASRLAAVAQTCPSGAITYQAADAELNETPPAVNLIRLRENGPYAVNADIRLAGKEQPATRRTLCRCGASRNKPYCDGSHAVVGFQATGEPDGDPGAALSVRDGPLCITPLKDGPLEIEGPVEMVTGTGRTILKTTHVLLCRCGGSKDKPYCDGSHSLNGFCDAPGLASGETLAAMAQAPPLAVAAGGRDRLRTLTAAFYARVPDDPVLAPIFAHMSPEHAGHVADFIAEVFGGETGYTAGGGSHAHMIGKHLGRHITEAQRAHWLKVLLDTADAVGIPDDPAFRRAFSDYLEWGSRLAVINSAEGVTPPPDTLPMPRWGWGAALRREDDSPAPLSGDSE